MSVLPDGLDAAVDNLSDQEITDNRSDPKMFVVFHDNAAYPEYLTKFKIALWGADLEPLFSKQKCDCWITHY